MDNKRRDHIGGIKPVGTPIPHRINQIIIKESTLTTLTKLNPAATKNMGRCGVGASDGRSNEREKEKEEFQEKFHKDEQKQKDEGQHWE